MIDPEKYTFVIRKTEEDDDEPYVARVVEFPYLVAYGKTHKEAYEAAVDTIRSFTEEKLSLPNPLPDINEFSGRISLRIPKSLHRKLSHYAEIEGTSINQFLGNLLSWASENYYNRLPITVYGAHSGFPVLSGQNPVSGIFSTSVLAGSPLSLLYSSITLSNVPQIGNRLAGHRLSQKESSPQKSENQILEDKENRPLAGTQA